MNSLWGAPYKRKAARNWRSNLLVLVWIGIGLAVLGTCSSSYNLVETGVAKILGGVVFTAIYGLSVWRRGRLPLVPRRARSKPPLLPPTSMHTGTVRQTEDLESPATGRRCVAYAVELRVRRRWGAEATIRFARTCRLKVELGDGYVYSAPAGAIRLEGKRRRVKLTPELTQRVAKVLKPLGHGESGLPSVPFDFAVETLLVPGDRVRIAGAVDTGPASAHTAASTYRSASWIVEPLEIPAVQILK